MFRCNGRSCMLLKMTTICRMLLSTKMAVQQKKLMEKAVFCIGISILGGFDWYTATSLLCMWKALQNSLKIKQTYSL